MKCLAAIAVAAGAMLVGCHPSDPIQQIAQQLRPLVPPDWDLSVSNNAIRLCSKYEVALIGRVSRPAGASMEELAKGFGQKTRYEMTLTFVPLLTKEDYYRLKVRQAPFLYILDHGAGNVGIVNGKTLYGEAMRGYYDNPVPSFFTSDYSIFVHRPVDRFVETYPSNALVQAESMLSSFRKLFKEYDDREFSL